MKFEEMVTGLFKPGQEIADSIDENKANMLHATIGISTEAGELLDAIKKHVIYGKPLDMVNITEELGDLEFYMEALRQILNINRQFTLEYNSNKLLARYPGYKYTDKAAQERADKT